MRFERNDLEAAKADYLEAIEAGATPEDMLDFSESLLMLQDDDSPTLPVLEAWIEEQQASAPAI